MATANAQIANAQIMHMLFYVATRVGFIKKFNKQVPSGIQLSPCPPTGG